MQDMIALGDAEKENLRQEMQQAIDKIKIENEKLAASDRRREDETMKTESASVKSKIEETQSDYKSLLERVQR
jgi:FtsZ-binding cell division protein ZapB